MAAGPDAAARGRGAVRAGNVDHPRASGGPASVRRGPLSGRPGRQGAGAALGPGLRHLRPDPDAEDCGRPAAGRRRPRSVRRGRGARPARHGLRGARRAAPVRRLACRRRLQPRRLRGGARAFLRRDAGAAAGRDPRLRLMPSGSSRGPRWSGCWPRHGRSSSITRSTTPSPSGSCTTPAEAAEARPDPRLADFARQALAPPAACSTSLRHEGLRRGGSQPRWRPRCVRLRPRPGPLSARAKVCRR